LIVVCGRGLTGLLLHLIAHRLRRLLLTFPLIHLLCRITPLSSVAKQRNARQIFAIRLFRFGVNQESSISVA